MRDFIKEMKSIEQHLQLNESYISNKYKNIYLLSKQMIEIQYKLFEIISWTLRGEIGATEEYSPILVSGFLKSLMGISGCIELNSKGLYGSSRIIMRHIYEYLMIAKYCSVSKDMGLYNKWDSGHDVSLRKHIFKHLKAPSTQEFEILWDLLCKFTHASKYSQQIVLDIKEFEDELRVNHSLVLAFIEMSYHLLNSHMINNSMLYYMRSFGDQDENDYFKDLKKQMRELIKISRKTLSKDTKKLIYEYKLKWII